MLKQVATLLVIFAFAACQYDPHAGHYTTTEPNDEDIVGEYALEKLHLSIAGIPTDIEVELRPNHTFTAKNLPPRTHQSPGPGFHQMLVSGDGHWEKGSVGTLHPGGKTIWGIYLRTQDNRFHPANLSGKKHPYGLIFTLGDPDTGDAIFLRRKPHSGVPNSATSR